MANSPIGKFWLAIPWLIIACGLPLLIWWMVEPAPITVNYVSPLFLSRPATDRADAATVYVSEVTGGSTVFRYISYCVTKSFEATSHRSWVGEALVWHAPDLPTILSRVPGCFDANIAVSVPTSSPTRTFEYTQTMSIPMNPIRIETISYAPIPLTILDPKDCKQ
jgi:hypothetical protein